MKIFLGICIGESNKKLSAHSINNYFYCKHTPKKLMSLQEAKSKLKFYYTKGIKMR